MDPTYFLTGQTVVIVGGLSPIGRATAAVARDAGARVVTTTRGEASAPGELTLDLGNEQSIERAAAEIGECDHVISLAAARAPGTLLDIHGPSFHDALSAKVIGPTLLAKHLAGRWREGGSLTLVSGVADERPAAGSLVMSVANGAANALVRALALELAPVRVNAISPGMIDTGSRPAATVAATAERIPAAHVPGPEVVASTFLSIASNPYLTGAVLPLDGGLRLV